MAGSRCRPTVSAGTGRETRSPDMRVLSEVRQDAIDEGQHPDGAARDGMRRRLAARRFIAAEPEHHARVHLQAALNVAGPVRCSWLFRMIAKLGSAARASGSLSSDGDLEDLARFGRADVGRNVMVLRVAETKRERNAKRPPRRNRAGALLESLHHTSSDCRTQESELCWPIRARTAARR